MKTKIISILVFAFLGMYTVNAQVEMMKSAEETARRLDELEGKSTPQRRENAENSTNYDYPDNNRSQEENERLRNRWEEMFGRKLAAFKEGMDKFDSPGTKCIFMMVIYLDAYMDIADATFDANDCKTKHDGYAMQSIAIAAATSIMYCPESLINKTNNEKYTIWYSELDPILANEENSQLIIDWKAKLERVTGESYNYLEMNTIDNLAKFFHPNNIIAKLLDIQQNLEELNCPD